MKSKKKQPRKKALFEEVLELLNASRGKSLNYKQVASALDITDTQGRQTIVSILEDLHRKDLLEETERGKYRSKIATRLLIGKVDMTQSGAAYVSSPDAPEDIYIAPRYTQTALHGDLVEVKIFARKRGDGREEGEIVQIVERARSEYVGTLHLEKRIAFVNTDNNKLPDFIVPLDKVGKAKDGQKVVVKMTSWEDHSDLPHGEIMTVLGDPGKNETEMHAIMIEFGLPYKFPSDVEKVAELIPTEITAAEIAKRRDFRNVLTFTIDPFDAKDFDDALSIRPLEDSFWEVGVHIADVSHYLKQGTLLDKEAVARATSVYLVDRVVPMLPEILSNFVCSLRPDEEKLCFSAVFEMDENATIRHEWFGRTVIRSQRRYAYEDVQEILEGKSGDNENELRLLNDLAKKLRAERFRKGSVSFDREEVKFNLDAKGNPIGVYFKTMKDSNQLIEDFMLLANRRVSEYVALRRKAGDPENQKPKGDGRRPFVYRIHNSPDPDKVKEFSLFVKNFGYKLDVGSEKATTDSLNKLLKDVHGKPEANLIETLAVRTMPKAIYSTNNIGHYGLGFSHYTHFTSPIRRYPDVMVHRLLQYYLDVDAGKSAGNLPDEKTLENDCKHSSEREKLAAEAERASIKYMQVQFLKDKIGGLFDGIVSGVTEWGFFVELKDNKCEGMVHVRSLTDDRYVFEAEHYRMRGMRSGRIFTLGDPVRVIVKSADLQKKQIDFELVLDATEKRTSRHDNDDDSGPFHPTKPQRWDSFSSSGSASKKNSSGGKSGGRNKGGKGKRR